MEVLVVGGGGREHSLAWKLAQSPKVKKLYLAPGNAGTTSIAENIPISKTSDILAWVEKHPVDLVVIGPDNYLAEGIVDALQERNIKVFGPTRDAAEIEWSKSFAKELMQEEGIPTAKFKKFTSRAEAQVYVAEQRLPIVIKASGLALGKGVVIAETLEEANTALKEILEDRIFGDAGSEVVIEEFLEGQEISIHAFCDGDTAIMFPASQDHKRIFAGDTGPNTGGMGTITPVPWINEVQMEEIKESIVLPILRALKKRGRPFAGLLYPGLMMTKEGPKVLEFNARFGDPETESYMRILTSDLADILIACVEGSLARMNVRWEPQSACCITLASGGYPGAYKKGFPIVGIDAAEKKSDIVVFHFGTTSNSGAVETNGGRVLGVTAVGGDLKEALQKAYTAVGVIHFEGMQFRSDIGARTLP